MLWTIMGDGLPVLRHDWRWPAQNFQLAGELESLFDGWSVTGLGEPQPYPTFYWIGLLLYGARLLLTPWTSIAIVVAGGAFVAARSAAKLVSGTSVARYAAAALVAVFAVLNPWVYAKEVAGHVFLVLAYALLLAFVAEASSERPRDAVLVLLAAASVTLIEFYAIVVVPIVVWSLRTNRPRVAAAAALAGLPIAYGIVANLHGLAATPYNLAWQDDNSVDLGSGVLLAGYNGRYTGAFEPIVAARIALCVFGLGGIAYAWRTRSLRACLVAGVCALFVASGTKGPLLHPYAWVVVHVKASGLFRELDDLIAFVAIAQAILLAGAAARFRIVAYAGLACALCFVVAWIRVPPRSFAVDGGRVPAVHFAGGEDTRVALYPAFQPMRFAGAGSGTDPDLHARAGEAVPINSFLPSYPVDAALTLGTHGRFDDLQALGVATQRVRPYLQADAATLRYQTAFGADTGVAPRIPARLAAMPVLGLVDGAPTVVSIGNRPAEFGVVAVAALRLPQPSARTYDAGVAWIDARLTTMRHPYWATVWGGVATSSRVPLSLARDRAVLAAADGRIVDDRGRVIVPPSVALHWYRLPGNARALTCVGACAIAAFGDPGRLPEHAPNAHAFALGFHLLAPWLVRAELDTRAGRTLRFAERYDASWVAFAGWHELRHVALASALNGWTIDRAYARVPLVLVETTAAVQFVLECVALVAVFALAVWEFGRSRRARATRLGGHASVVGRRGCGGNTIT